MKISLVTFHKLVLLISDSEDTESTWSCDTDKTPTRLGQGQLAQKKEKKIVTE